jgi:uncharacterized protein (DUF1800 family)
LGPAPAADLPLNYNYQDDPNVPIGQSWVYAPIIQNTNYSQRSIRAWQFGLILNEGVSLREKMVLFWHNHFVTADSPHAKYTFQYIDLLRNNALGLRTLRKKSPSIPDAALFNGNESNKNAPNENYAGIA